MSDNTYYRKLINSQKWLKLRLTKMAEAKGLCEECLKKGITTPATEVHHITPVESGITKEHMKALCYDPLNLKALCRACHKQAHIDLQSYTKKEVQKRNDEKTSHFVNLFLRDKKT